MKSVIIGLPLLILVVLFFSFYDFGGNSVPPKTGDESKQENTSNKAENTIVDKEQSDFEWKVDSILKFGAATEKFQKEFKNQKGYEGKSSDDLRTHIQNNSRFSFEEKEYTYQEAKEEFIKSETTLEGGVFTVSYFDAKEHPALFEETKKNKKKEVSPKSPNVDKDCIDLQKKLKKERYYNGNIDGDCGKGTDKAKLDFEADNAKADEIARLEKEGWERKRPKFTNIKSVKFNGVIDDEIKGILLKKLDDKTFNFQLTGKESVMLYLTSIKVEDVNTEIKRIQHEINENDKIDSVSFSKTEVSPSYPLKVNGVTIGHYNYKEKQAKEQQNEEGENMEAEPNQGQQDKGPTDGEESEEESQEEPDKSND